MNEERFIHADDCVKHFKGGIYKVLEIGHHTETGEKMVVYIPFDGRKREVYIRPYDMFMSEVDHEKYPDVKQKYRMKKINENNIHTHERMMNNV